MRTRGRAHASYCGYVRACRKLARACVCPLTCWVLPANALARRQRFSRRVVRSNGCILCGLQCMCCTSVSSDARARALLILRRAINALVRMRARGRAHGYYCGYVRACRKLAREARARAWLILRRASGTLVPMRTRGRAHASYCGCVRACLKLARACLYPLTC